MTIHQDITTTIGHTPLVKLNTLTKHSFATILAKLEFFNPGSSIKDRIALNMITKAEELGILKAGGTIVEPTSGNTGIGLAIVAATRNYKLIITMPENMSVERRKVLIHLGATLILTPSEKGMQGAIERAKEITLQTNGAFMPQQFDNPQNALSHQLTTGPEIWADTNGNVDILVLGVGTGGSLMGIGNYLKKQNKLLKIVAIEPADSAVLQGQPANSHQIQGIGAGFIPSAIDMDLIDEVISISNHNAIATARALAKQEGIFCGISSGAAMFGALELGNNPANHDKTIVTIFPDAGDRYTSTPLFE
jgi:cysteine synthase A